MKRIITICCALAVATGAFAQGGLLGSLKGILGGSSSDETASTATDILGSVLGSVISQAVTVSLPGSWTYNGCATAVETDNTLTTLAATAYKENLEKKLDTYLGKVGIKAGAAVITYAADNTFSITNGSKVIASGTYTYTDKTVQMKFGKVYNYLSMTGTVAASLDGCQILFDADKFLAFASKAAKVVSARAGSTSGILSLVEQVKGLKIGFDLKR